MNAGVLVALVVEVIAKIMVVPVEVAVVIPYKPIQ